MTVAVGAAEQAVISRLCATAQDALGMDAVAAWVGGQSLSLLYSSDDLADRLEDMQSTLGEGPTLDVWRTGGPVAATDLDLTHFQTRWPDFTLGALGSGVRAVFVLPLREGAIRLGGVSLYRIKPGGLSRWAWGQALGLASGLLEVMLSGAAYYPEADTGAIETHQATGMVSVQLGVTLEQAFVHLRQYAREHEMRLSEVSRRVLDRRLRFTEGGRS
ncbi:MAG: GAF and ANTAR domain-containing protein [Thermoactinospora sp.]|nr:GAF and ANTAR domain-containing protein [Thermoactinospora sp.]